MPTGESWPIQIEEVSQLFKIPRSTVSTWKKEEENIINTRKSGRSQRPHILCYWPELELVLYKEFIKRREEGRMVRRGWFRRTARRLFNEQYPHVLGSLFCFSVGWFTGFLRRFYISLRFTTNKAQKLPQDYVALIQAWLQFNRRHSQPRPYMYMETVLTREVGRYMLKNICNLDETPICFEYLTGRTYSLKGLKTIWAKATKSGWSKRQATLVLCVFADGIARIPPVLIFHGKGSARMNAERQLYDPRVSVEFNPTAYNNKQLFLKYIDQYLIPTLNGEPGLFVFDSAEFHKTTAVLERLQQHDIVPSIIPGGCTSLIQPLDISINKPLKEMIRDFTDEAIYSRDLELEDWKLRDRRILTTKCIADSWVEFNREKKDVVIRSFRQLETGISLPIDGSCDSELNIKGLPPNFTIGNWRSEEGSTLAEEIEELNGSLTEIAPDAEEDLEEHATTANTGGIEFV